MEKEKVTKIEWLDLDLQAFENCIQRVSDDSYDVGIWNSRNKRYAEELRTKRGEILSSIPHRNITDSVEQIEEKIQPILDYIINNELTGNVFREFIEQIEILEKMSKNVKSLSNSVENGSLIISEIKDSEWEEYGVAVSSNRNRFFKRVNLNKTVKCSNAFAWENSVSKSGEAIWECRGLFDNSSPEKKYILITSKAPLITWVFNQMKEICLDGMEQEDIEDIFLAGARAASKYIIEDEYNHSVYFDGEKKEYKIEFVRAILSEVEGKLSHSACQLDKYVGEKDIDYTLGKDMYVNPEELIWNIQQTKEP